MHNTNNNWRIWFSLWLDDFRKKDFKDGIDTYVIY